MKDLQFRQQMKLQSEKTQEMLCFKTLKDTRRKCTDLELELVKSKEINKSALSDFQNAKGLVSKLEIALEAARQEGLNKERKIGLLQNVIFYYLR